MIRKTLALALAMLLLLGLVACESKDEKAATTKVEVTEEATTAAEKEEATEAEATEAKVTEAEKTEATTTEAAAEDKEEKPEGKPEGKPEDKEEGEHVDVGALDTMDLTIKYERDPKAPFKMTYPESLKERYGEAPEFDQYPEKIIILSTSTLYLMSKLDVEPIAVSRTVKNTRAFDAYGELPTIDSGMNTVDTETIVSMEPDLVIMSGGMREKFGSLLEELEIPVFYTSEGPVVSYEQNKAETLNLAGIFGGEVARDEVAAIYQKIEDKAKAFKEEKEEKTAMILFGMDSSYQASSKSFFGGILSMLPFQNLTDLADEEIRVAPIAMENVIKSNPQYLFLIAPPMGYDPMALKGIFMASVQKDPQLWENVEAVQNGNIIALPGNYTTSKGLEVVQDFNNLIDLLAEVMED